MAGDHPGAASELAKSPMAFTLKMFVGRLRAGTALHAWRWPKIGGAASTNAGGFDAE
jgi:hypothetical protein